MYEFMHAGSAKPPDRAVTASACPSNRVARRLREGRFWVDSSGLGGSSVPPFRLRRGHNVAVIWLNATVGAGKSVVPGFAVLRQTAGIGQISQCFTMSGFGACA